jgi:hypothetical protein
MAGRLYQTAQSVFFDTAGYKPIRRDTIKPPPHVVTGKKGKGQGENKRKI